MRCFYIFDKAGAVYVSHETENVSVMKFLSVKQK